MTAAPDADVLISLLRHLDERLGDSHAEGGADVPPPDWTVDGHQVDPEQRAQVITEAAGAGYIEITHQDRFPLPTAITAEGRQLAER